LASLSVLGVLPAFAWAVPRVMLEVDGVTTCYDALFVAGTVAPRRLDRDSASGRGLFLGSGACAKRLEFVTIGGHAGKPRAVRTCPRRGPHTTLGQSAAPGETMATSQQTITLVDERKEGARDARPGILVLFSAEGISERVEPLGRRSSIGRTPDNGIRLNDAGISRHHATFLREADELLLVDEGSRNGTFVNGQRLTEPTRIVFGDVIRVGETLLLCVADVSAYAHWPVAASQPPLLGGPLMQQVARLARMVAPKDVEVLIEGESGTGKELVARLIHDESGRSGPFVAVNCAAIPEALFEAELFGVVRGAFTGADSDRPGLVTAASGGTLFLDEVAELPLAAQAKLLRALEQRESRPVGGTRARRLDLKLVAATHHSLRDAVQRKDFRLDLFHRICGFTIHLPALHERREDVILLAERLIEEAASGSQCQPRLTCGFVERLLLYRWPGNVRELQRALHEACLRAVAESCAELRVSHLRRELSDDLSAKDTEQPDELQRVRAALARSAGNVKQAATALGIRRQRIYELLREHRLSAADFR
jgi:transcriptional regulator with AAA-type ATPase domain